MTSTSSSTPIPFEANETVFKVARQYHEQNGEPRRWKFVSRYRAYHGNSMGSLAATARPRAAPHEPLAPGFLHVAPPTATAAPTAPTGPSAT